MELEGEIRRRLRTIEQNHELRILYACESGSRAWGFPSPDSDYDVRFVYIRPRSWYLSIDEKKDSLVLPLTPDRLDLSGWDIRKALRLFRKSNVPLLEWLHSPITYYADSGFLGPLRELEATFFAPRRLVAHYLGMARSVWEPARGQEEVPAKELLYMLRALLAARWTIERKAMPPVGIQELLEVLGEGQETRRAVGALLAFKLVNPEAARQPVRPVWHHFFRTEMQYCRERLGRLAAPSFDGAALDGLFRQMLDRAG